MSYFGPRESGIIFAADLPTFAENARVLEQIGDRVDVIKINIPLVYREGPSVIRKLHETFSLPVFADLKVADVPHTNNQIVAMVRDQGGAAVMVHGIVGPDGIREAIETAKGGLGIIVQLELTHPGGRAFTAPIAEEMAQMAAMIGTYGVQAPGNRPHRIRAIREIVGPDPVIVCCGVGAQGGQYHQVVEAGGTYAIIGRAIYQADNPKTAIQQILDETHRSP